MAALIIPSRRVWQPQGAAQIDRNSQIGRGLREALVPSGSHLFYAELGRPLRFAGAIQPVVISGQFGVGIQHSALSGSQEYIGAISIASDATLAVVGRVPSSATNSTAALVGQSGSGSQLRISIGDGTTAGVVRAEAYIGGATRVFGGSFTLPVGSDYIAIARHKNGVLQDLWVNGIQDPATLSQAGNFIGLGYFGRQGALSGTPIFLAATWQPALGCGSLAVARRRWRGRGGNLAAAAWRRQLGRGNLAVAAWRRQLGGGGAQRGGGGSYI